MVELELLLRRPPRIGIYVAREHRRAPEVGLKTLTTGAFAHNEASIELFEGFGFEVWPASRGSPILTAWRVAWL